MDVKLSRVLNRYKDAHSFILYELLMIIFNSYLDFLCFCQMNADFPNPAKTVEHVSTRQEVTAADVNLDTLAKTAKQVRT